MNSTPPKRIQIVGISAAGKSTVAREIGQILHIEVIHLDTHMWQAGCQLTPPEKESPIVEELLKRPAWIIDGNYTASLPQRLKEADAIVMVDFPRWLCFLRAFKRIFTYFGRTRPDMGKGCPERVNVSFFKWIWRYPYDERPELLRQIATHGYGTKFVRLRGHRQTQRWLEALRKRYQGSTPRDDSQQQTDGPNRRTRTPVAGH
jgi:adenylate kinase family enzyme